MKDHAERVGSCGRSRHVFLLTLLTLLSTFGLQCGANRPPTLIRNIDLSVVNENTPIDSQIFQLVALDPEGSPVTYALNGTNVFRVDRRTGVVYVAAPIDREQLGENIQFTIVIEDQVGNGMANNVVRIPVTVYVIDENDNPPQFQVNIAPSTFTLLHVWSRDTCKGSLGCSTSLSIIVAFGRKAIDKKSSSELRLDGI
jgi:hypothetical protein